MARETSSAEARFDIGLGRVLRIGTTISALLIACGAVMYLTAHGADSPDYHVFSGQSATFRSSSEIIAGVTMGSGRGLIQFGILTLIATPVARVLFSVIGFAFRRDWLYVGISFAVLMLLSYSLTFG